VKIALDFDETYTAHPSMWDIIIQTIKEHGHDITFVTYRFDKYGNNDDITSIALKHDMDIVYTNGKQKSQFFEADIWIDDMPITIPSAIALGEMYDGCLVNGDL
jgi:hypothetical protein